MSWSRVAANPNAHAHVKTARLLTYLVLGILLVLVISSALLIYQEYPAQPKARASFQDDLERIQKELKQLTPNEEKYAFLQFQKAQMTGNFDDFYQAEQLLEQFPDERELVLIRTKIALSMHDLIKGKQLYDALRKYPQDSRLEDLAIDIALQEGQYPFAINLLSQRLEQHAEWSDLARYAHLLHKSGNSAAGDRWYAKAQAQLSIKHIKEYAWLELQRGIIDLENTDYPAAQTHFALANKTYPGHWLIEEHLAETYALLHQPEQAIALYQGIIQQSDNPLYFFALGDLLKSTQPTEAEALFRTAEEKFQRRYLHYPLAAAGHLIDRWINQTDYAAHDKRALLLQLTQTNLALRPNADSLIQRIKVLRLEGELEGAQELTKTLLTTPWRTADVLQLAQEFNLPLGAQLPINAELSINQSL